MEDKKSKGKIVIVEDDMLLSLVEGRIVEKLGYKVAGKAVEGEEAVRMIKEQNPDVVLMDISLKGKMDGIEVMTKVRDFSDVPVIYLSGNSNKHNMARAKKTSYIDFLVKPISADEMIQPLKKAMNVKRSKVFSHAS
jgi:two-component system, response regulator PdtaR